MKITGCVVATFTFVLNASYSNPICTAQVGAVLAVRIHCYEYYNYDFVCHWY